jgi:hypothetical protein
MNAVVSVVMFLSLSTAHLSGPLRPPVDRTPVRHARSGGRWYFAASGHAVYCLGPVRMLPEAQGGIQRVATFCQGDKPIVPLRD